LRKTLFAVLAAAALVTACAHAPQYHYAFDPTFRFTPPKTYAWYDDPNFKMPGGSSIADGRFVDENVRRAIDETLAKKGVAKAAPGAKPDIYVSYSTNAAGVVSQDRFGAYSWWSGTIWAGTKYQKEGTIYIDIRDASEKLVWRGLKTAIVGTNPDAMRRDIERAVSQLLAEYPPPPGAKNAATAS
jgi:Domain of unknown function (DUF4136)